MLAPGSRLGSYEVLALLGAGGMGEVFRARDSRLGRHVALKVLREDFAFDAERRARFEHEARIVAALNHPNIATLYGIEESTGSLALVLELVEGITLADRLAVQRRKPGGGLDVVEALGIAVQVAAALDAAHEHGIVHRDLKPANIALTRDGTVKVLDFGLAQALAHPREATGGGAPTITGSAALAAGAGGAIAGTPAYMSPEQVRGLRVDKRADVWAFGCVLYEMLSGERAFAGDHTSDVIAKILERDANLSALPADTPPAIRRLIERCLCKDPKRRLRDIGDARFDPDDRDESAPSSNVQPLRGRRWARGVGVCAAAVILGIGAASVWLRPEPAALPISFTLAAPARHELDGTPVPSPAGNRLAFVATAASGESALWIRSLDSPVPRRVSGTEGASRPFWSPDGRFVGFGTDGNLKRVDPDGGPVQIIASLAFPFAGATWNRDGVILFAPANRAPLSRVPAAGGTAEPVTVLDGARGENSHRWPSFLPDGRHFLFTARAALPEHTGVYVGSLDSPETKWLLPAQSPAVYVASGFLLFARDGALLAQRFDARTLELSGDVHAITGQVPQQTEGAWAAFAASADGTVLAWGARAAKRLIWFDRNGTEVGVVGPTGRFSQLRLAADGARAAVVSADRSTGSRDIWVVELATGALTRVTSHPANDWFPVWSPDGAELLFSSDRDEMPSFYRAAANGAGAEKLVFRPDLQALKVREVFPTDWAADGRHVAFHSYPQSSERPGGIWVLPLVTDPAPSPLVQGPFTNWIGSFSPDGRWLAYVSDESGSEEIYLRSLETAARFRVSVGGGSQPRWRGDARELFFVSSDNRLMAASVSLDGESVPAPAAPLFFGCGTRPASWAYHYDVSADGSRSLWLCPADGSDSLATVSAHRQDILGAGGGR
jgi:eukaryotic-like serine/threonine-protein kinase